MQSLVGHPHCSLCWETTSILLALRDIWNLRILQKLLLTFAYFKFLRCLINEPVEKEASMVQLVQFCLILIFLTYSSNLSDSSCLIIFSSVMKKQNKSVNEAAISEKSILLQFLVQEGKLNTKSSMISEWRVRNYMTSGERHQRRSNVIFVSLAKILHIVQVTE